MGLVTGTRNREWTHAGISDARGQRIAQVPYSGIAPDGNTYVNGSTTFPFTWIS